MTPTHYIIPPPHSNIHTTRGEQMNTPTDVLNLTMTKLYKCYESLKVLGFKEPMYAPKNIPIQAVSFGSTGVHTVVRWDDGSWWCPEGGDLWPYHPIMWRATL